MANWIRSPTGRSKGTCKNAQLAISFLRNITRWLVRLAWSLLITRLQQVYVNGFKRRYEIKFPGQCQVPRQNLGPTLPESNQMSGHFSLRCHGTGWAWLPPSLWPF